MYKFFNWLRNLFRRPQWRGWKAINHTKVDSPEDWRDINNS